MNTLRDPFSIRSKPADALSILRSSPVLQNVQKAASSTLEVASSTIESISESAFELPEKFDSFADGMSFALPRHIPSFSNSNREREDLTWSAKVRGGGGVFKDKELPLYKDKPYYYQGSYRRKRIWKRKRFWGALVIVTLVLYWLGIISKGKDESGARKPIFKGGKWSWSKVEKVDWNARREKVKEAFLLSWNAYERHGWGYDVFLPVSKKGRQMAPQGMGWIIIDTLDTMMLMNLTTPLSHAREWVSKTLTWDQDQEVNTFETTIRMLGGLLSAHYLQTELKLVPLQKGDDPDLYLEKATDLAERLMGAYDSPSGVPWASVNLKTSKGVQSHVDGGASSTAEATTLQLEMKYLSKLTGEEEFWQKAEKVMQVIDANNAKDGLVPIFIYATDGQYRGSEVRLGSRGDSYYEYLLKQYLLTNKQESVYQDMYNEAMNGVKKHLVRHSHPSHLTFIAELPGGVGGEVSPKMDHLVCFLAGNLALGATEGLIVDEARREAGGRKWGKRQEDDLRLARELTRTCYEMYNVTESGLAPEIAWFNMADKAQKSVNGVVHDKPAEDIIIKRMDAHNLQRPETVESLFIMWRLTKDEIYRQWGWNIFNSFLEHASVQGGEGGFTSLDDVTRVPTTKRDNMESFWLAETLKYLYLLFSPDDLLPLDKVVFNTEAHPFPKFDIPIHFKGRVGWKRLPRDGDIVKTEKAVMSTTVVTAMATNTIKAH